MQTEVRVGPKGYIHGWIKVGASGADLGVRAANAERAKTGVLKRGRRQNMSIGAGLGVAGGSSDIERPIAEALIKAARSNREHYVIPTAYGMAASPDKATHAGGYIRVTPAGEVTQHRRPNSIAPYAHEATLSDHTVAQILDRHLSPTRKYTPPAKAAPRQVKDPDVQPRSVVARLIKDIQSTAVLNKPESWLRAIQVADKSGFPELIPAAWREATSRRTAETPVVSTVHKPFGSPSGPGLFHVKGLQLPAYIQNVAHAFVRRGMTESEAIQRAVGVVRDWASGRTPNGRGRVHPDVQAAARKAIAEWEAAKAAAHAQSGRSYEGSAGMEPAQFRAQMSTSDINDLPDDAFAYIEPGGTKDSSGKTVPREKRHFPVHDAAHVRDALGRAPQSPFGDKAMPKIKAAAAKLGVQVNDGGRSVFADEESRELRITSQYKGLDSRLEIRSDSDGQWVGGYASVFMPRESRNLGGFIERVSPDAFNEARAGGWTDVVCRFNHDSNYVLGTAAAGTLRLRTDNVGLDYQVLPPQAEERIRELVARGDIRYSSFAFRCRPGGDDWGITDQNFPMRTLHDIELVDVAPVLTPAYKDATAAVRATTPALRSLAEHMQIAVDEVRSLAEADELRRLFVRTDKPIYRPEPKKLFGPAAAAMLLARRRDPYDQD